MRNFIFILLGMMLITSCEDPSSTTKGCIDGNAINYDYAADIDDGSCTYSNFTFYSRYSTFTDPYYNTWTITNVDISINGNYIGSTGGTYYPTSPNNCYANGTVSYQTVDGSTISWNAIVYLSNGQQIYTSGTTRPNRYSECVKINVTN